MDDGFFVQKQEKLRWHSGRAVAPRASYDTARRSNHGLKVVRVPSEEVVCVAVSTVAISWRVRAQTSVRTAHGPG